MSHKMTMYYFAIVAFGVIGFIAGVSMAMVLANLIITALHTIFVCFAEVFLQLTPYISCLLIHYMSKSFRIQFHFNALTQSITKI